jgi:hypothetical protein
MKDKTENKEVETKKEAEVEEIEEIVTIKDFKSMLVGLDLALGKNWTPDENQWKRIRRKIDALIETHEKPSARVGGLVDYSTNVPENNILRNFPTVPGGVPESVPVGELAPAGQSALAPPPNLPPPEPQPQRAVADGRDKVKTPDIDSSTGYKSNYV